MTRSSAAGARMKAGKGPRPRCSRDEVDLPVLGEKVDEADDMGMVELPQIGGLDVSFSTLSL
jgi:hypothetical protein